MRTISVLSILLVGCANRQPKPVAFNPQDISETKKWLAQITTPYVEALGDLNVYGLREAKQKVVEQIGAVPKNIEINWTVDFIAVHPSKVQINTHMEDKAMLTFQLSPNAKPDDSFEAMDMLQIGSTIDFAVAKDLRRGDKLVVTGILNELKPRFDDEKKFASFVAIVTNAKARK
jgi:hypothetical protein